MQISWKWLNEWVDLSATTPELVAELLTNRGIEVEEILHRGRGLEKVITVRIEKKEPHPQADRLSLCQVTTGESGPIPGLLEIVCGAQNMKAGDTVCLAQIGAELPCGLKIELSKIRGMVSNGMLCSEDELGMGKPGQRAEGLILLPSGTPLGRPVAEIFELDDVLLSLKLTANRADCLSHAGIAREIAAALSLQKNSKISAAFSQLKLASLASFPASSLSIQLMAGSDAPQFMGCLIEGVRVCASADSVKKRLESLGSRSINTVVDATNLLLFELGHPVHAYDADLLREKSIGVRAARAGEKLMLLDSTEITLAGGELVIADGRALDRVIGLAGVMGGKETEVSEKTTRVFLECAQFSASLVRRASSKHQKKTDASHRFERGIDSTAVSTVMARLVYLIQEGAGGSVSGVSHVRLPGAVAQSPLIQVPSAYFSRFLGMTIDDEEAIKVLEGLGCAVERSAMGLKVSPPSYRLDLNIPEDLAEEVARSVGYDRIHSTVPALTSMPLSRAPSAVGLQLKDMAKDHWVQQGLCESLNLAFTSKAWLAQLGMTASACVVNPLSEDHEALVPSLLPGLIRQALDNWRHHFGSEVPSIRLFEMRPVYVVPEGGVVQAQGETTTGVQEHYRLSAVISGSRLAAGLKNDLTEVSFYDIKAIVESLFVALGTKGIRWQSTGQTRTPDHSVLRLLHPGQSAEILAGNQVAGWVGLLHPSQAKSLKTRADLWLIELDWQVIAQLSRPAVQARPYQSWSAFPSMERDFALLVKKEVACEKITQTALKAGRPLARSAKVFDIYQGNSVPEGMTSVAVKVIFLDETRSLQEAETEAAVSKILTAWQKELNAQLRS